MLGRLDLVVDCKEARSYIADMYFTAPFKVMNISPRKALKLDLMIMSSSPGMLDKDDYQVTVTLQKDSYLNLHHQAYQRIYPAAVGVRQKQVLRLGKSSTLVYLASPLVPHREANFTSHCEIHLEDNATLILGEILTCGRKNQEELFAFELLKLDIEVMFVGEGLIFKEKQYLNPSATHLQQLGLYAQFTHQASLYVFNNKWDHIKLTEELTAILMLHPGIEGGVTPCWKYGTVVKVLGTKAEELVKLLDQLKDRVLAHQSS